MKGTATPARETPPGCYVCTRCGRIVKNTRDHTMCRDCLTIEADLADPERVAALDQKLDPRPRTHCKQGHPYTIGNTSIDSRGWIVCLTCKRDVDRRRRAKERNA